MTKQRIPVSTYRLQLHRHFTFDDAAAVAQYLYDLGVSHVYSSPYLQAGPDSMHGYDVVDHQKVNAELGGEEAHRRFSKTLGENGLGQILDIVPNHMAIGRENRFWWDVLENGSASRYASFFDIDWQPQEQRLRNKVLVPILGDQYGRVLESGGIHVSRSGPTFVVEAAGQTFPVAPRALPTILARAAQRCGSSALSFVAASFARLPEPSLDERELVLARHRDKLVLEEILSRLCADEHAACAAIDDALDDLNADQDLLDGFLNQQNFRLSYWKTADQQLGYRRFFDVNNLVGLRMERPHVFEETHARVLGWLRDGVLDGVRIDHPDGLRDPQEYFARLRKAAPAAWIVGEKILARGEFLRGSWPIDGTSGYDFMNMVLGLFVAPEGLEQLTAFYAEFTGQPIDFAAIAHDRKLAVANETLGSDVNRLTSIFVDICETRRNQRDFTRAEIRRAIREIAACFAIYRTYVVPGRAEIDAEDRDIIARAIACAKQNRQDVDSALFDFFAQVLSLEATGQLESEFVLRFQQFTSPVMAKGVEDTAFYCYNRLTALCEVGGDPAEDGVTIAEYHAYQKTMQATHPNTMTALSTHDTKRSDDVRARLAVLTEMPAEFAAAVSRWSAANDRFKTEALPDRNTEYFLYQTLIGAWPIDEDRLQAYMQKAMREAKQQTSWVENNKVFEDALRTYIAAILGDKKFVTDLEAFVQTTLDAGRINSLTQTLLKHTAPGVPDLYQGGELWDLSLVDPDNRRPVDYALRRRLLDELAGLSPQQILARMDEGLPKLHVVHTSLLLRRQHATWFAESADYTELPVAGSRRAHVLASMRAGRVVSIAPRLTHRLAAHWDDTTVDLPAGRWCNRLTRTPIAGGTVAIADLLADFPVALLTLEES